MQITKKYKFNFDKHKEETVEEVMESDPSYLVWCCENIKWFKCDKELEDEFEDKMED